MSFDSLRIKVGRKPVTIVELDLDFCGNSYGVSPCAAAVGTTGTQCCFNTFPSCQDTANYAKSSKTYAFCSDIAGLPVGMTLFPCLSDVSIAPTQLSTSGVSVSATATVTLKDFPHHDRGVDPYADTRAYDPRSRGTFFGKLRSRNPYMVNRVMRVKEGYLEANGTISAQTRTYFIDRFEGPDANGVVKIYGKDPLRFADTEKAQAPVASKGTLSADLTNIATSLTLLPAGVGDDYPTSGTIRIDDELMTFSGRTGDTLTGLGRASDGTTVDSHDAETSVQLCIRYTAASVPAILKDLLVTYAGIDAGYIDDADWANENDTWLGSYTSTVVLSDPAGVKNLINEVLESSGSALWWDDLAAQWRFKVIVPFQPGNAVTALNETQHILQGTFKVKDLEKERISRVVIYYNAINAVGEVKRENFRTISVQVDATSEGPNAYGTPLNREILSRWLASEPLAGEVSTRLLSRYKETPRQITFQLDAKDAALKVGQIADISSRLIQADDGLPRNIRYIVTEVRPVQIGSVYEYVALQISPTGGGRTAVIAPDDAPDWADATETERLTYWYISDDNGRMPDLSPGPTIT